MEAPLPAQQHAPEPIGDLDDLLALFREAETPREAYRVGTEAEKFGLLAEDLRPLPFEGERSVRGVLSWLARERGWNEEREYAEGEVISLRRDAESITLEPAGQLELSGAPHESVHRTCAEFRGHIEELTAISKELDLTWLSVGFHPFARHEDLPRVPKLRYGIMERYMPTRGPRSADMMRRTCTVQANLDYCDEDDAMRKLRVSLALQPVFTGMFANSPFYEGRIGEHLTERGATWLQMDVDRSGILPFAWERDLGYRAYVEWALDVPMFMVKRGGRLIENTGQSFRGFMTEGAGGERATRADWEAHVNSLFPEARLKRTLEVRGADAQPNDLVCAVPALWKGLLYDDQALAAAESLIAPLDAETVQRARPDIVTRGLRARLGDREVQRWAEDVVDIARGGLQRQAVLNARGEDETIHLARLTTLLQAGQTPADVALSRVRGRDDFARAVVEATRV
ncbi:MAG: glutamate-cysteine ligase family protein [Myxococcales bacterium]